MTPTGEETLQAESDAAVGAIVDAVRKARDDALEEAADAVGFKWETGGFGLMRRTDLEAVESHIRALKSTP